MKPEKKGSESIKKSSAAVPRSGLYDEYLNNVKSKMMKDFGYGNEFQVPKVTKIVLSMGLGKGRDVQKNVVDLGLIAGQKPEIRKAKESIAQFSVRKGQESGARVTLRGQRMYHFLDRFINVSLLMWRAFQGVPEQSINLQKVATVSIGVPDKRIFLEIKEVGSRAEGLNVTICTNCRNREEIKYLLTEIGLPFKRGR